MIKKKGEGMTERQKQRFYLAMMIFLAGSVAIVDLLLPPQIETDFFFILPLLLGQKTGRRQAVVWASLFASAWTVLTNIFQDASLHGQDFLFSSVDDFLGLVSVWAVAWFVIHRMRTERELNNVIDFIDGRLGAAQDNERLRGMR